VTLNKTQKSKYVRMGWRPFFVLFHVFTFVVSLIKPTHIIFVFLYLSYFLKAFNVSLTIEHEIEQRSILNNTMIKYCCQCWAPINLTQFWLRVCKVVLGLTQGSWDRVVCLILSQMDCEGVGALDKIRWVVV